MRKLYIIVAISFLIAIFLFIASFVYLDKSKHATYFYVINRDGADVGTIKVDKFETEDMVVYKSSSATPFEQDYSESKTKIELDRKYDLQSYVRERRGTGSSEMLLLESRKNGLSFLERSRLCFTYLDDMQAKNDSFVFEEKDILTYLPIIDNYNFKKGRAQGFNGLVIFSSKLPPMKKLITLTSIKDEYLKIGSMKIKTENLIVKIRNYPQAAVWVAKSDRSVVKLEIPQEKIRITRMAKPVSFEAKKLELVADGYSSKDVVFNSKKLRFSGTMTFPNAQGPFPTVLLIPPPGPEDREYCGLFTFIADYLSKNGFCTLRFDKRGTAQSTGDASSHTFNDELEDLGTALSFLGEQKEVDVNRISVITHSGGAYYALRLVSEKPVIRTAILMSPSPYISCGGDYVADNLKNLALKHAWSDDYLKLALKCVQETEEKAKNAPHNWTFLLGKICFAKNLKEEMAIDPMDVIKNVKIPVLILQGKNDADELTDAASILDKTLTNAGNKDHVVRYYSYLGSFLGEKIDDGVHKTYYEADKEVLDNIRTWLDANAGVPK